MVKSIAPVEAPLQSIFVFEEEAEMTAGAVRVVLKEPVHPFASVIVTEYAPAASPVRSSEVALFDQSWV